MVLFSTVITAGISGLAYRFHSERDKMAKYVLSTLEENGELYKMNEMMAEKIENQKLRGKF